MADVETVETPVEPSQPKRRGKKTTEPPAEIAAPVAPETPEPEPKRRGRPKKPVDAPPLVETPVETSPPAAPEAPPKRRYVRRITIPEEAPDESSSSPSPPSPPKRKKKATEAPNPAPPDGSLGNGSLGVDFWTKMLSHHKDLQENHRRNQYASFRIV
jgi:hypothetical protein